MSWTDEVFGMSSGAAYLAGRGQRTAANERPPRLLVRGARQADPRPATAFSQAALATQLVAAVHSRPSVIQRLPAAAFAVRLIGQAGLPVETSARLKFLHER
jgi:hypothetical protein